jgi:hypothetical protein
VLGFFPAAPWLVFMSGRREHCQGAFMSMSAVQVIAVTGGPQKEGEKGGPRSRAALWLINYLIGPPF